MPVPTKEDLFNALSALQAQPENPYKLQFEAPMVAEAEPNREQQFKQDWDVAMQAYEQGMAHLKTPLTGISYGGQNELTHTPEEIFNQTIGPLRFRAGEFSPGGITGAFTGNALEQYRQAELEHQKKLEEKAQEQIDLMTKREQRLGAPKGIPSSADQTFLEKNQGNSDAWDRLDKKYGDGTAQMILPDADDPRVQKFTPGLEGVAAMFPNVSQLRMPQGNTAPDPFAQMPSRPQFTVPGPTLPSAPTVSGMVDMVDDKGAHWSIPQDKVADAEKKYKLKKLQ